MVTVESERLAEQALFLFAHESGQIPEGEHQSREADGKVPEVPSYVPPTDADARK